jgi:hypothetical protein
MIVINVQKTINYLATGKIFLINIYFDNIKCHNFPLYNLRINHLQC